MTLAQKPGKQGLWKFPLVKMKRSFQENNYPIKCVRLQVREIAEMADLLPAYEEHYRVYCKFTHSAMMAVSGNLNLATDSKDTHVVVWCVGKEGSYRW